MAEANEYGRLIVTDTKELNFPPEMQAKMAERMKNIKSTMEATRLLWLDNEVVKDSSFYMEVVWHWSGKTEGSPEEVHVHDHDELIGFIGTVPGDPHALGAEIEIYLNGEKHILTKSCLIFLPAGVSHAPIIFRRIDYPFVGFTLMASPKYVRTNLES
jgi:hypothetical protein